MAALAEALDELNLRITEVTLLYKVAEKPGISSSEIGRDLGIKRSNMTPLVSGLINSGYINTRVRDGRSQSLTLTRSGRSIFNKARKIIETHEQRFIAPLSDKESRELSRLIDKLQANQTKD